jgi:hypothetical protein
LDRSLAATGPRLRKAVTLKIASAAVALLPFLLMQSCHIGERRNALPPAAQTALESAIEDIDDGSYDQLYLEAADEWRSQSSLEDSKATFETLHNRLGRARSRSLQTAREEQTSTGPTPGHSVTVIYQTSFDRGYGIETFTLIEHRGKWALAKYYVSSSGLK